MTKLSANVKLIKGFRMVVDDEKTHGVLLDLPIEQGGTNIGPTALHLCAMSYAGCYAMTFALTAGKMRIPLKDLAVKLESVKSDEAGTITETAFEITVKADAPKDRIQRLHKLTVDECPVGKLFERAGVKASYDLRVAE